jgi:hypothetical protein
VSPIPSPIPKAVINSSPKTKQQKANYLAKTILGKNAIHIKGKNKLIQASKLNTEQLREKIASSQKHKAERKIKKLQENEKNKQNIKIHTNRSINTRTTRITNIIILCLNTKYK